MQATRGDGFRKPKHQQPVADIWRVNGSSQPPRPTAPNPVVEFGGGAIGRPPPRLRNPTRDASSGVSSASALAARGGSTANATSWQGTWAPGRGLGVCVGTPRPPSLMAGGTDSQFQGRLVSRPETRRGQGRLGLAPTDCRTQKRRLLGVRESPEKHCGGNFGFSRRSRNAIHIEAGPGDTVTEDDGVGLSGRLKCLAPPISRMHSDCRGVHQRQTPVGTAGRLIWHGYSKSGGGIGLVNGLEKLGGQKRSGKKLDFS